MQSKRYLSIAAFITIAFLVTFFFFKKEWTGSTLPVLGPENHVVPPFTFINQDSIPVSSDYLQEKIFVADFFFTRCAGICPKMTTQMKRVQDTYAGNENFRLVSFTVNPERDSPAVLESYMEQFGANPQMWTMFTGEKAEIYKLARSGYFITAVEGDGGAEDFIHSERLVLVDADGKIRGYYDGTDSVSVDKLIGDIAFLMKKNSLY